LNKKTGVYLASILFVTALLCVPLILGQTYWDFAEISAYGTDIEYFESSTVNTERYAFTVAVPPSGSEITNTIYVMDNDSGENYTINLSIGDRVEVNYQNANPIQNSQEPAQESQHFIIIYEGPATGIDVNTVDIPEFSPILILPFFITATLIALIYRKKHTK
jgi:hypothetical protein